MNALAPRLLTREQAAAYLGRGLTAFKALALKPDDYNGKRPLYDVRSLDAWADARKAGRSARSVTRGTSVSVTTGASASSPQVQEIAARLRSGQRRATRKSLVEDKTSTSKVTS